ncbi:hypothetical protein SJAV_12350 [Sulfurisphaera javensis]|uniref:Uncharacterized protein n=1 Tax=Sulfurisphaera javensis TaxID=2049879 RepID=A0AAT9GQW1_9CREN
MEETFEEKSRHSCFMKDKLYKELKNIADEEGRTVYDVTNIAVDLYISLYRSLGDDVSYLQVYYRLLKHLVSVGALTINTSLITPADLSLLISSYISTISLTEEGKINKLIGILDFIAQLLRGVKANMYSSQYKQDVIYKFENENIANYFENFCKNLLKGELTNSEITYEIKKSDLMVEVKIEQK